VISTGETNMVLFAQDLEWIGMYGEESIGIGYSDFWFLHALS
jgi:hypothetical protein